MWCAINRGKILIWVNPESLMLVKLISGHVDSLLEFSSLKHLKIYLADLHQEGFTEYKPKRKYDVAQKTECIAALP